MAPRKTVNSDPVQVELDPDDIWAKLNTEEFDVPPLKVRGIVLEQPSLNQVDEYKKALVTQDEVAAQKALFGDAYGKVRELFGPKPPMAYEKFLEVYLTHFFGAGDDDSLKG